MPKKAPKKEVYDSSNIKVLKGLEELKKDQECTLEIPMTVLVYTT